jgi:hypothetical protein
MYLLQTIDSASEIAIDSNLNTRVLLKSILDKTKAPFHDNFPKSVVLNSSKINL